MFSLRMSRCCKGLHYRRLWPERSRGLRGQGWGRQRPGVTHIINGQGSPVCRCQGQHHEAINESWNNPLKSDSRGYHHFTCFYWVLSLYCGSLLPVEYIIHWPHLSETRVMSQVAEVEIFLFLSPLSLPNTAFVPIFLEPIQAWSWKLMIIRTFNSTCTYNWNFFKNKSNRYLTFGAGKSQASIPF